MSARNERILITGGAGFIGSHVAEALVRRGATLTLVDNFDPYYPESWKRANLEEIRRAGSFEFQEADAGDGAAMRRVFGEARPEAVIHLAARAGVRASLAEPEVYERINVGATRNVLERARETGLRRFLYGSSSSVYGETPLVPFTEEQNDLRPISPYATTKLAGEKLGRHYAETYGLPVVALRFFSVYGERQRPDLAIHKFTALMEAGQPIPVFGDGSSGRDYTHVMDIVEGVLGALEYGFNSTNGDAPFEVFNLGNSHPVELNELIGLIERATGKRARRECREIQPGEVSLTWADVSKAARLLGYRPGRRIEEGLNEFVKWYRSAVGGRSLKVGA